jgi:hypothetical protein
MPAKNRQAFIYLDVLNLLVNSTGELNTVQKLLKRLFIGFSTSNATPRKKFSFFLCELGV